MEKDSTARQSREALRRVTALGSSLFSMDNRESHSIASCVNRISFLIIICANRRHPTTPVGLFERRGTPMSGVSIQPAPKGVVPTRRCRSPSFRCRLYRHPRHQRHVRMLSYNTHSWVREWPGPSKTPSDSVVSSLLLRCLFIFPG